MSIKEMRNISIWTVILIITVYVFYKGEVAIELLIAPLILWVLSLLRFLQENYFKRRSKDKDVQSSNQSINK
jgi:CDP-diglyceride synthetase